MAGHTCFVVSPIGDKGSEIRKAADDVYELIIEPALEKFGFTVTRADKISSVGSITTDVIEQLQNADLCVIDISGHNANVMYECGRRHETGKPYILIAREGEKLPFDINTIRTFFYNLERPREIRVIVKNVQEAVSRMLQEGFQSTSSGESLASVVDLLRRIERKVDSLHGTPSPSIQNAQTGPAAIVVNELVQKLGIVDAWNYAMSQADTELMDALIPKMRKFGSRNRSNYVYGALAQGAAFGSLKAFDELENEFPLSDEFSEQEKLEILACYITAAGKSDLEDRALKTFEKVYGDLIAGSPPEILDTTQRAFLLNQYQRLLYGMGRYDDAARLAERVVDLEPRSIPYLFNLAIVYEKIGRTKQSLDMTDKFVSLVMDAASRGVVPDSDHLRDAARRYAQAGSDEKFWDVFRFLERYDQAMASVVKSMPEARKYFGK